MALSQGMLQRFKKLASERSDSLLMVNLGYYGKIYGYLREVGADFFVMQEVQNDIRGVIKPIGRKTINLDLAVDYTEGVPAFVVPSPFPKIVGV
jgi:hypothetical protein